MRKTRLGLVISAALLVAGQAHAQFVPEQVEFCFGLGWITPDERTHDARLHRQGREARSAGRRQNFAAQGSYQLNLFRPANVKLPDKQGGFTMRRLLLACSLVLACLGAQAQSPPAAAANLAGEVK